MEKVKEYEYLIVATENGNLLVTIKFVTQCGKPLV